MRLKRAGFGEYEKVFAVRRRGNHGKKIAKACTVNDGEEVDVIGRKDDEG